MELLSAAVSERCNVNVQLGLHDVCKGRLLAYIERSFVRYAGCT